MNSLGITAVEVAAPLAGGLAIPAVVAGSVTLLGADAAWTTTVQVELVADIARLYECPLSAEDDDEVWQLFSLALGITSGEEVGKVGAQAAQDVAVKQFRKWLRDGLRRKKAQEWLSRKAGERVAKWLSEKYLLRLIPMANVGISAGMNHHFTSKIGISAKRQFAFRSSLFKNIDATSSYPNLRSLVLSVLYWVASRSEFQTQEFLELYAKTSNRLELTADEQQRTDDLNATHDIGPLLDELKNVASSQERALLMDVALTTAALAQSSEGPGLLKRLWSGGAIKKKAQAIQDTIKLIAAALRVAYKPEDLKKRVDEILQHA